MLIIMCHNAHVDCTVRVNGKRVSARHVYCLHVRLPVTSFCSCCGCDEDGNARTSIGLQNGMCVFEVNKKKKTDRKFYLHVSWFELVSIGFCLFENRFVGIGDIHKTHR